MAINLLNKNIAAINFALPIPIDRNERKKIVPPDLFGTTEVKANCANNIINLFVLSQNADGTLKKANDALKRNLINYLLDLKMLTDRVIIRDAFIINISVDFEIAVLLDYNANEVLLNVIDHLKEFFRIEHWQIGQVISLSDIRRVIYNTSGVRSINSLKIKNECDATKGYNNNFYDIDSATLNDIIYPSIDPSIFEVKFPNENLKGSVRN